MPFYTISLYDVKKYQDGWWVVEEFEDCGHYSYEKVRGPYQQQEDAEEAAVRISRREW